MTPDTDETSSLRKGPGADAEGPVALAEGLRVLRAPNPSPMTHTGTNTYLLGERDIGVIDPGPSIPAHLDAILHAVPKGGRISHILVTHAHRDHSLLAGPLSDATGAPVLAAGGYAARRRPVMAALAEGGLVGGGEGVDVDFAPDQVVEDGECITGEDWRLEAIATPGHIADHLSFAWGEAIFTGDHVMGWASSLVSPPDGDLTAFLTSCERLAARPARAFYPGHGDPVTDPAGRLAWLVSHRGTRDAQIRAALGAASESTPAEITKRVYTDVAPALLPAAERNVLAHLIAGWEAGKIFASPALSATARFSLA